jgi:hypothetical protein
LGLRLTVGRAMAQVIPLLPATSSILAASYKASKCVQRVRCCSYHMRLRDSLKPVYDNFSPIFMPVIASSKSRHLAVQPALCCGSHDPGILDLAAFCAALRPHFMPAFASSKSWHLAVQLALHGAVRNLDHCFWPVLMLILGRFLASFHALYS